MNLTDAFYNDFTSIVTHTFAKQILSGVKALNMFIADNRDFFSYPEYSALKGYMLNYSIESSLRRAAFTPKAAYKAIPINVNSFGRSILRITTDNFHITTAKTHKWNTLPAKSKYKLKYAQSNAGGDGQMCFDFEENTISSKNDLYYALLTYGYNSRTSECSHIDLIVPSGSFNAIIKRKDILPDAKSNFSIINTESEVEETVVALNSEFEKIVKLKSIISGDSHE